MKDDKPFILPKGKTVFELRSDAEDNSLLKKGDEGYIEAYLTQTEGPPFAVFVRLTDGIVDFVSIPSLKAIYLPCVSYSDGEKILHHSKVDFIEFKK